MTTISRPRIQSIDVLRGIAMLIMALDHVRDFFHVTANVDDPLNLATTTPALFFTRWITHYCAPVFVFLSGTSIYLQGTRKSSAELSSFLIKRGLWLILAEWTIIALGWTFDPGFHLFPFQVIWTIGISMVILGLLIRLKVSYAVLGILGLVLVAGHNLLDIPESAPDFKAGFWWDLLHHGNFAFYPISENRIIMLIYPFPPWTGLMMLGYCLGKLYSHDVDAAHRRRLLTRLGLGLITFFVLLRYSNVYGDPVDWTPQQNGLYTFLSFLKVNKYPPSLLYLCITIGPSLLLLAWVERFQNRMTNITAMFGRTAFFYYILHIYVIHLLAGVAFFARGHSMSEASSPNSPFLFVIPGEGLGLLGVYCVWALVLGIMYPLSNAYDKYKRQHKEKWWLSYL